MRTVIGVAVLVLVSGTVHAREIVVDLNGGGEFTEIQPAIDAAEDGDTVLVEPGEYVITEPIDFNRLHDPEDPQSPPVKNITLRSETGAEQTIIRMAQEPADPTRTRVVVFENGETEAAVLRGFQLTGGRGSLVGERVDVGGGVLCVNHSSPTVIACVIAENTGLIGSGLACIGSSPMIRNCRIEENVGIAAEGNAAGGGVFVSDGAAPVFESCRIEKNELRVQETDILYGGGLYCGGSTLVLTDCQVSDNVLAAVTGEARGGGIHIRNGSTAAIERCQFEGNRVEASRHAVAGGMWLIESSVSVVECEIRGNAVGREDTWQATAGGVLVGWTLPGCTLTDCVIEDNEALAAVAAIGAGCYFQSNSEPVLTRCVIAQNRAQAMETADAACGGGVDSRMNSLPVLDSCRIVGNKVHGAARSEGAGVHIYESSAKLVNCLLVGNSASSDPGGNVTLGGGLLCFGPSREVLMQNSTMAENTADEGEEIYCDDRMILNSCIVWSSQVGSPGIVGSPRIDYSCVRTEDPWSWGEENINADPLFCKLGVWDDNGTPDEPDDDVWIEGDYGLNIDSPCILTGEDDVNMGADLGECGDDPIQFLRGDVNADAALDISDAIFTLMYLFGGGTAPTCLDAADANDDGAVDLADAIAVLSHLFAGSGDLPEPFGACGIDPTVDELGCSSFPPCE